MPAPNLRLLSVKSARHITPNMIRVTLTGPELRDFPDRHEGANCKILIPEPHQSRADFAQQLENGPKPITRTYTIRAFRKELLEVDIDFVVHGDPNDAGHNDAGHNHLSGPACNWAQHADENSFLAVKGPGSPAKMTDFYADHYILAADMSALPLLSATLEAMPQDAKGIALFETLTPDDQQDLIAPQGIEQIWLVHAHPNQISTQVLDYLKAAPWPSGVIQTCIAGESNTMKALRQFLLKDKGLPAKDVYISGYWKIGLIEDEHQKIKRLESEL